MVIDGAVSKDVPNLHNSCVDEKAFEKLKRGFEYLEEYDKYGDYPDKRIVLSITIPIRLRRKLDKKENVSRFIEKAIEDELSKE